MNDYKKDLVFGTGLIILGLLILAVNLGLFYVRFEYLISGVFLAGSAYLFTRFLKNKSVGLLVLAAILAFVGTAILIDTLPFVDDDVSGVLFFWIAAALCAYGYLRDSSKWGWLIPSGVLFTLGLMVLIDATSFADDDLMPGTFFLGLAATFGLLYLIRNEQNKLDWAKIPALILVLFSGFIYFNTSDSLMANLFLPLALIAFGGYLIYYSSQSKSINNNLTKA